ncbi:MAG: hypothetical protein AAF589_04305 [Planctomycetota bacterium]
MKCSALLLTGSLLCLGAAPAASAQSGSGYRQPPARQPATYPPAQGSAARGSAAQDSGASGSQGSDSHGSNSHGSGASQGSSGSGATGSDARQGAELALRGFCPVSLCLNSQWVEGEASLTAVYDNKQYQFADAKARQIFRSDPVRYAPALGGDNVIEYTRTGRRVPGDFAHGMRHAGRVYFFGSREEQAEFGRNPATYADADLVLGGDCVVCRVDMNQAMPGSPQLTTIYDGLRYQFYGREQQRQFAATPARFVSAIADEGSGTRSFDGSGKKPDGSGMRPDGSSARPDGSERMEGSGGSGGR